MDLWRKIRITWKLLNFGGSRRLRNYEQVIFDHALRLLDPAIKKHIERDLVNFEIIQRWFDERVVRFFFGNEPYEKILDGVGADEFCLVTGRVAFGKLKSQVKIDVFNGRLHSLEIRKLPRNPEKSEFKVLKMEVGGALPTLGEEIDLEEHGGNYD